MGAATTTHQFDGSLVSDPARIPDDLSSVALLIQQITGSPEPVPEAAVLQTADLLDSIARSPHPAAEVANHLSQIDGISLALLEINLRQARADRRVDLADALKSLKTHIELLKAGAMWPGGDSCRKAAQESRLPQQRNVHFLAPSAGASRRASFIVTALEAAGCAVEMVAASPEAGNQKPDVLVACNPHLDPRVMASLAACAASKIPIVIDLDTDFERLPLRHPDYSRMGLTIASRGRAFYTALALAGLVTTTDEVLAASLRKRGYPAVTIPEGWSRKNPLWESPTPRHETFNLGWISDPGTPEDLLQIRRAITRVLREFPYVQLVLAGDERAYRAFDTLADTRRLFLPALPLEEQPYLLSQMDIFLVPLQTCPYSDSVSDRRLLEAGIRAIPWVATPLAGLADWCAGGVFATQPDEWYSCLRDLILNRDLRASLGRAGRQKAETREATLLAVYWLDAVEAVLAGRVPQDIV